MGKPGKILNRSLQKALARPDRPFISNRETAKQIDDVCRSSNRAPVRLLLSCLLAKLHNPRVDIRKPYTKLGGSGSFSGRTYDEKYVQAFVLDNRLPCNSTTAFLTPSFRVDRILKRDLILIGRPQAVYQSALALLDDIQRGKVKPTDTLCEIIRILLIMREERSGRMQSLLADLRGSNGALPLSSEQIVTIIEQHLKCRNASRLPVLVVAAAYQSAQERLGERVLRLHSHNAADKQTGSLGDVEITLANEEKVVTSYEMKMKRVAKADIDLALHKLANAKVRIDNYIFITTDTIDPEVAEYARGVYEQSSGIEFAILDCLGFLRHFLHLFHRLRIDFLNSYQRLVIAESESAISQPLKEVLLTLRRQAELTH